jgi:hypothetical protein
VDGATADARRALERAACRAGRFVNLNRDACAWVDGPRPYPLEGPARGYAADVWVREGDGRDAAALEYFRRAGVSSLQGLERGILWRLLLLEPDAVAARRLAEDIAVTRARRHGLLANPHSQTHVLLHVLPGPGAKEMA